MAPMLYKIANPRTKNESTKPQLARARNTSWHLRAPKPNCTRDERWLSSRQRENEWRRAQKTKLFDGSAVSFMGERVRDVTRAGLTCQSNFVHNALRFAHDSPRARLSASSQDLVLSKITDPDGFNVGLQDDPLFVWRGGLFDVSV